MGAAALPLNPHYRDWYHPALRLVYFFAENFEKSFKFAKQVKEPFAFDYAFLAMNAAYLGTNAEAKSATANALHLDPSWSAEGWISSQGGFAREQEAYLFARGAQKAGLPMYLTQAELKKQTNTLRFKICDQQ